MSCCPGMEVDYKGHREILDFCGSHVAVYIYENEYKCKLRRVNFIVYKLESGKKKKKRGRGTGHIFVL